MNQAGDVVFALAVAAAGITVSKGAFPWSWGTDKDDDERIKPVASIAALDPLFAASRTTPTLLFLHDPGCPISRAAYKEVMRLDGEVPLLDVRGARALTRAVEERTGVRHESPQIFVLSGGQAVWSASHYAITTEAVANAVQEAS